MGWVCSAYRIEEIGQAITYGARDQDGTETEAMIV
jgi:hypothetical protein